MAQNLSSKREQLDRVQDSHVLFDQLLKTAFLPYFANNHTHLQHHALHWQQRSVAILEHYEKYLQVAIETVEFFRKRMKRTSSDLHVSDVRAVLYQPLRRKEADRLNAGSFSSSLSTSLALYSRQARQIPKPHARNYNAAIRFKWRTLASSTPRSTRLFGAVRRHFKA